MSRFDIMIISRQVNTINIRELINKKHVSKYQVSKNRGIQYITLNNIAMEELLDSTVALRIAFDLFKSNVCHHLKN